jgi:hypothetical protein
VPASRRPRLRSFPSAVAAGTIIVALLAACSSHDGEAKATTTSSTSTTAPDPAAVLATCTPAVGSDFVSVEKHHLINGAQHLGQGFVADGPDGRYLAANVYSVDNVLLASGLSWRILPDGTAQSAAPESNAYDNLPDVPPAELTPHPELAACVAAATALG